MSIWEHKPLGELCSLEIGGTPARNNPLYWDSENAGSNYWVSIADLKAREITETEERITKLGIRHSNAKLFKKGTVLLSFKLTVGRVAIVGRDLYTNEAIAGLTSEELDHHFLYYGLQHWNLLKDVDQAIKGITLNKRKLKRIDAHYPSDKKEQTKIAEVLSTIDRAIAQTEALIAKHQRIKTGLMQDLLTRGIDEHGQLRDPSTHRFKSTPLGVIPVEWEVKRVSEISTQVTDGDHLTPRRSESGVYLVSARNIINDGLDLSNVDYVDEKEYSRMIMRCHPEVDDILISCSGSVGRVCLVPSGLRLALVRSVAIIKFKQSEYFPEFAKWVMQSHLVQIQVSQSQKQAAQPNLFQDPIKKLLLPFPNFDEQKRIAEKITSADATIKSITSQLSKLISLRTGLMQDLLSGGVSVKALMEG